MKKVHDPGLLGLADVDLKTAASPYVSEIQYVGNQDQWAVYMTIANDTGDATTGLAKITVTFYDDAAGSNALSSFDALTAINTKVDGTEVLNLGRYGATNVGTGTPGSDNNDYSLVGSPWMEITITVTEVNNDSTTAVGNVWLVGEESRPA